MGDGDPLEATANYDAAADESLTDGAPAAADMAPAQLPERIGRYRIERVLGKGGFGLVYLAQDDQLSRPVAIKVPHRNLVHRLEDAEAYLTEARTVANLDHPHIVPVFDVGSTEQFPFFVVSKYIDGTDLPRGSSSPGFRSMKRWNWWRRWPRRCTTLTSKGWSTGTSSPATSCSTGPASRSWPTSGWRCVSRMSGRDHATPGHPLT